MIRLLLWISFLLPAYGLSSSSPPDLYAFPKYRVDLTRDFVSNATASSILAEASPGYELMRTASGQAFLCKIPAPEEDKSSTNSQSTEKVEQASLTPQEKRNQRQMSLQAGLEKGLALLEPLKGACLYQRQGWFTYAFCYGKSVRQFHEIRTQRGPQEDPNTHSYVLGQYPAATSKHEGQGNAAAQIQSGAAEVVQANTEVGLGASGLSDVLSADSDIEFEEDSDTGKRYLVQHWTGGTSCDMTGLERKVEVQFHCNTQSNDRIALIRETAICQYVLVIHTPRLCGEPLFLAAGTTTDKPVGSISCQPIVSGTYSQQQRAIEAQESEPEIQSEANHNAAAEEAARQALPEELEHTKFEVQHQDDADVVVIFDDETGQVLASSQADDDQGDSLQNLAQAVQRSLQALNVEDDDGVDGQTDEERLATVVKALFGTDTRKREQPSMPDHLKPKDHRAHTQESTVGSPRHKDLKERYNELFSGDTSSGEEQEEQQKETVRVRDEL